MALKRIIPCLLYDGVGLVKTVNFRNPSYVGDPINAIKIFNDKEVDELILLDINASKQKRKLDFVKIMDFASEAFMPFAYGGGVKLYEDFVSLFKLGVEKVIVNSLIQENPEVIKRVVTDFGSQAVVASVDFRKTHFGGKKPWSYLGHKIKFDLASYLHYLEGELGVGELMLCGVDKEGTWEGYDYEILSKSVNSVAVPVIACGGCGSMNDLKRVLYETNTSAAAVGSMAVYSKKGMGVLINFPDRNKIVLE